MTSSDSWAGPIREHEEAVAAFVEAMERVPVGVWREPIGPGKWTPAQIVEHVYLAYRVLLDELGGGPPMKAKAGPFMQRVLRWFLLPHMLFHRTFPKGARSPREVRPSDDGVAHEDAVVRLRAAAQEFEHGLARSERSHLTHPYFGRVDLPRALRFAAVHTEHHRRQLDSVAAPAAPPDSGSAAPSIPGAAS